MSVRVMSLVWGWALPASEKLVALKLADCANDAGENAYPALATIAGACGLTRRGTQKVIDRLLEKGCIEVQADHTNRMSTIYRVRLEAVIGGERSSPLEVNGVHLKDATGGERGSPLEVNVVPVGGELGSPLEANDVHPIRHRSVLDPSYNPRVRDGRRSHPLDEPLKLEPWSMRAFDELLGLYPRPDARHAATRAWHTLNPSRELAEFIVAHVRTRLALGWMRDTPVKFIPQLRTFLDERRWQERYTPEPKSPTGGGAPDGLLVMRSCPVCGASQEGKMRNGGAVYPACDQCGGREKGIA